jgi:hypothetical protein
MFFEKDYHQEGQKLLPFSKNSKTKNPQYEIQRSHFLLAYYHFFGSWSILFSR